MSLDGMIAEAEKSLGLSGRPNYISNDYASRNGREYADAPWCDEGVTYWARHANEFQAVCHGTDYAYTVSHAQRFKDAGEWHVDTDGIRRGDIVFFDWDGSDSIAAIDHVGVATGVSGGYVYTIEANTSNCVARRVRTAGTIVGFGRPSYGSADTATPPRHQVTIDGLTYGFGAHGNHVTAVGRALVARGFGSHYKVGPGPDWSDADTLAYADYQRSIGLSGKDADGVPGIVSLHRLVDQPAPPKPSPPAAPVFPGTGTFRIGQTNDSILLLGRRLVARGFGSHYRVGPSRSWGEADRLNTAAFQRAQGWTGSDADGYPGPETWRRLFS
ncbi:peptidoglycan-binding protein [Streptomyces sp. SPB162]|uniref:peptidoglycan-binding protein n=1 Tax=Streptomyces sp. SPB162 TaxID=2940560 RepID=UPI002405E521|nr:peptidoglycan-binding protein [Streptomyces sp. SPB162]MDF9813034.1 hypothetical protein [Streptomyces sp. SPB162]